MNNDLKKLFLLNKDKFPDLGDIIILSISVDSKKYSKDIIQKVFNSVISKDEYDNIDKSEILSSLYTYTNRKISTL